MIGLCGAHRTGKTTLARAFSQTDGVHLVQTDVAGVAKRMGFDVTAPGDFETRLAFQREVLAHMQQCYSKAPAIFVTDRTPIDAMAYTLNSLPHDLDDARWAEVAAYLDEACAVCNRYFGLLMLLPVGVLRVVPAEGKALALLANMSRHEYMARGVMLRGEITAHVVRMPARCLSIEQRVERLRANAISVARGSPSLGQILH